MQEPAPEQPHHYMLPAIRWELGRAAKPLSNEVCDSHRGVVERHVPKDGISQNHLQ